MDVDAIEISGAASPLPPDDDVAEGGTANVDDDAIFPTLAAATTVDGATISEEASCATR